METLTCIALARELNRLLVGIQIALAEQADAGETLLIQLRGKRAKGSGASSGWLTMSSCLGDPLMFFHDAKPALTERAWPSPLSEHIERMYVRSVSHGGMDRVITIGMSASPGGGDGPSLHVELFSARVRAYLAAAGTGEVIEAHAPRREGGARGPARGSAYSPPAAPRGRLDPLASTAEAIADKLPPDPGEDDLVRALLGVGRTLAREALARSKAGSLEPAEALKGMLARAVEGMEGGAGGFVVAPSREGARHQGGATAEPARGEAEGENGPTPGPAGRSSAEIAAPAPMALAFEPSWQPHVEVKSFPTVNDAVVHAFLSCRKLALDLDRRRAAAKSIRARLRRAEKTRSALLHELAEAGRSGEYRLKGELLLAHMGRIPKGAKTAEVPHPDAPGGKLKVALDPSLSPHGNAEAYFKKARKLQKKLSFLPGRIEELSHRGASLQHELSKVTSGEAPVGLPASASRPRGRRPARERWPTGIAPRRLVSSDGWTMYVGRNNRENDYLTFAFAKPDDLWFHAHGVAGSHVVLRREERKAMPSKRCVVETAAAAAYFSKGRTSQTVAVVYTEKKHVRKPRKGKPGTALYSHERTVMVAPSLPPDRGEDSA